jgi:hypothetical protein
MSKRFSLEEKVGMAIAKTLHIEGAIIMFNDINFDLEERGWRNPCIHRKTTEIIYNHI